jgi:hypothetical protein
LISLDFTEHVARQLNVQTDCQVTSYQQATRKKLQERRVKEMKEREELKEAGNEIVALRLILCFCWDFGRTSVTKFTDMLVWKLSRALDRAKAQAPNQEVKCRVMQAATLYQLDL